MRRLTWFVLGLLLLPGLNRSRALAADPQQVEVAWSEISPLIVGREIALALPDGTYIEGKALDVQENALELDVKKTSDRRLHPKGKTTVPRASALLIELRKKRKFPLGGIAGGVAGYTGGLFLGFGIAQIATNDKDRPGEDIGVLYWAQWVAQSLGQSWGAVRDTLSIFDDAGLASAQRQTGVISEVVKAENPSP